MQLDIAAQTDIGRRKGKNEDSFGVYREDTPGLRFFTEGALLCVADGLGGHLGGDIASKLAVSHVKDLIKEEPPGMPSGGEVSQGDMGPFRAIRAAITRANESIFRDNMASGLARTGKGMGTTVLVALMQPDQVCIGNVGDSRCYHLRNGQIIAQTKDHSWVDEQVKMGLMTEEEAAIDHRKNVVTRCVGTRPEIEVDTYRWHIGVGDHLLLCTDGLVNMVSDAEIEQAFLTHHTSAEIAQHLVRLANENGGRDNITVVVAGMTHPTTMFFRHLRALVHEYSKPVLKVVGFLLYTAAAVFAGYWLALQNQPPLQ